MTAEKLSVSFHRLTEAEIRQHYKDNLINTTGYLFYIRRITCPPSKKFVIPNVIEFCKQWDIPRPSFYRAVDHLKQKGYMSWEATHGLIFSDSSKVIDFPQSDNKCLTNETHDSFVDTSSHKRTGSLKSGQVVSKVDSGDIYRSRTRSSDISDISDPPDSEGGEEKILKPEPERTKSKSASLANKPKELTRQVKASSEDKSSAAPCNNLLQVLDFLGITEKANQLLVKMEELQIKPCQGYSADRIAGVIKECDLSQLWGALRHIEETWESIHNPTALFCSKAPKMPVEVEYCLPEFDRATHDEKLAQATTPEESKAHIEKIKQERIKAIASSSGDKRIRKFADLIPSMPGTASKPNTNFDTDYAEQQRREARRMMMEDSGDAAT